MEIYNSNKAIKKSKVSQRNFIKRGVLTLSGLIAGATLIGGSIGIASAIKEEQKQLLENYINTIEETIAPRESYRSYAGRVLRENPKLTDRNFIRISPYQAEQLIRELNDNKELISGKKIILPIYEKSQ